MTGVRLGQNLLALSTSKGGLFIFDINLQNRRDKMIFKYSHSQEISHLEWGVSENSIALFFVDDSGLVFSVPLMKLKSLFFSPENIYKSDSTVVQILYENNMLLVSSLSKCVVVNLNKQNSITQIGSQLRDGR